MKRRCTSCCCAEAAVGDTDAEVRYQCCDADAVAAIDSGAGDATKRTLKAEAENVVAVTCTTPKRLLLNAEAETAAAAARVMLRPTVNKMQLLLAARR